MSSSAFFKTTWVSRYCDAVELTPQLANKLKSNTNYYALAGPWYFEDINKSIKSEKQKQKNFVTGLKLFSFVIYIPSSQNPPNFPHFEGLNDKKQYVHGLRLSLGAKKKQWYFGTGSGLDPVFIITKFIKVTPDIKGVLYKKISTKTKRIINNLRYSVPDDVKYFNSSGKARNILSVERDWNKKKRRYSVQGYLLPSAIMRRLHKDGYSSMDNSENYNIYENEVRKIEKLLRLTVVQHLGKWDDQYGGVQMDENGNIFVEFSASIKLGELENSISSLGLQSEEIAYVDY